MSSRSHNKKRNAILMYEFIIRTISKALMDDDKRRQASAMRVLKRCFKQDSELFKEFRIANALYKSTVSSPAVAASIMQEAKLAVRALDERRLEREKSLLIREVNYSLGRDVYDHSIPDYKILATIQTLFNEWRYPADIAKLAEFEDKVNLWLTTDKSLQETSLGELDAGSTRLMSRIMAKKLNEKYAQVLNSDQKELIRMYALNEDANDMTKVKQCLVGVKDRLLDQLREHEFNKVSAKIDVEKLNEVQQMLVNESLDVINDDTITRFMLYSKLTSELVEGDK